jgi:hypothetical protein
MPFVCERRRSRRIPSAIRSERSEQLNTAFADKIFHAALGTMETFNLWAGWTPWPGAGDRGRARRANQDPAALRNRVAGDDGRLRQPHRDRRCRR